jgi:6-phosphogluconolactonase (cycloisomerase 2 family)
MQMRTFTRLAVGAGALAALSAFAIPIAAGAAGPARGPDFGGRGQHPVFVQTDGIAGNQVVAYDRAANGTLTLAATYATGGKGGVLNGSHVDHLGSQGSLTYDPASSLLYAVNAGSNTVSVFSVRGDQLSLRQVVGSGGSFPVSVAVHGRLVSVLNAENGGSVQEFYSLFGYLVPVPGSNRNLGLTIPSDTTQFTHTPGQVAYSPDGSQLIVTTKATTNAIEVFNVGFFGSLSLSPVVTTEPGAVPFAIAFDGEGHLVVGEAGPSALATFGLNRDGTLTPISVLPSGQTGLCWVTASGSLLYTGNTAANSTSGYVTNASGQLSLLGASPTDPGTVDGSVSSDGHYLYVQTGGNGIVDEFQIRANGVLAEVGSVLVSGAAGGEGIAAT